MTSLSLFGAISGDTSVRGGKGGDYITTGNTFTQSYATGDLGGDTLLFTGAVDQSTV